MDVSGVLILNKPVGITSHDAVNKIRRLYGTKQVGHTGTLDPLASGVLIVLVGRAAKAASYLGADVKGYRATLRLGLTTDTEDVTGKTLTTYEGELPDDDEVRAAAETLLGVTEQIPPMYSAIKVGGKKLYELAREGKTVEREARQITVYSIDATPCEKRGDYTLEVTCSAGTYIRTLCKDIGERLGCGGVMATLERTRAGSFEISASCTLEELEAMDEEKRSARLIPVESLFEDCERIILPQFYFTLCKNGCEIYQKKIGTHFESGTRVRLCSPDGGFFAIGEVRDYEGGSAIKALTYFVI